MSCMPIKLCGMSNSTSADLILLQPRNKLNLKIKDEPFEALLVFLYECCS